MICNDMYYIYIINRNSWHQLEMKFEISRSIQMTSCCMLQFFAGSICLDLSSSLAMKIASLCRGFRFAGPGCEFIIEPCNNLFEACGYNVHGPALQEKACIAVGGRETHVPWNFSFLLVALLWIS